MSVERERPASEVSDNCVIRSCCRDHDIRHADASPSCRDGRLDCNLIDLRCEGMHDIPVGNSLH